MPARKKFDPKGRSKIYSGKDLGQFKKRELVAFLKARGVPTTGNLKQLLSLAKVYADRPEVISDPEISFKSDTTLPKDSVAVWHDTATEKPKIPSGFTLLTITSYLSLEMVSFHEDDGEMRRNLLMWEHKSQF